MAHLAVAQENRNSKMEAWQVGTWTTTCGLPPLGIDPDIPFTSGRAPGLIGQVHHVVIHLQVDLQLAAFGFSKAQKSAGLVAKPPEALAQNPVLKWSTQNSTQNFVKH